MQCSLSVDLLFNTLVFIDMWSGFFFSTYAARGICCGYCDQCWGCLATHMPQSLSELGISMYFLPVNQTFLLFLLINLQWWNRQLATWSSAWSSKNVDLEHPFQLLEQVILDHLNCHARTATQSQARFLDMQLNCKIKRTIQTIKAPKEAFRCFCFKNLFQAQKN